MSNKISFVTVDQTNNPHLLSDFNYEDFLRKPIEGEQSVYELSQKTILTQQEDKVLQHFRSAYHLHVHVGLRQHLPCNCVDEICWHNTVEQTLIVALPSYFSLDAVQEDGTFFDERLKSDIFSNYNCRFVGKMQVVNRPCVKKEMLKFLSKI